MAREELVGQISGAQLLAIGVAELLALTLQEKIVVWPFNSHGQLIFREISRLFNE